VDDGLARVLGSNRASAAPGELVSGFAARPLSRTPARCACLRREPGVIWLAGEEQAWRAFDGGVHNAGRTVLGVVI
jgi:hypothetical protein